MKYIIEFEDEYSMNEGGMKYHQCKQVPYWSVSHGIIKNLTPYTEPDLSPLVDEAVETIENEVWDFVRIMSRKMDTSKREKCFGKGLTLEVVNAMTYQEAKAKYEAWKKQKYEIRVGDEVKIANTIGVVTRVPEHDEQRVHYIAESGTVYCNNAYANIVKTGRHFNEVEELLRKMEEK